MRDVVVVLFSVDGIIVLLALPLALGWVKRNSRYGLRTKRTLADGLVWDRANRFAGRALILAAALHGVYCWLQLRSMIPLNPSLTAAALTGGVAVVGFVATRRAERTSGGVGTTGRE